MIGFTKNGVMQAKPLNRVSKKLECEKEVTQEAESSLEKAGM